MVMYFRRFEEVDGALGHRRCFAFLVVFQISNETTPATCVTTSRGEGVVWMLEAKIG